MRKLTATYATATFVALMSSAAWADTLKIAHIDPLSGPTGVLGELAFQHLQFAADNINAKGGINGQKVEVISFDNKMNPQESTIQAQKAIEAGARVLTQGIGSAVAISLLDFVAKHNARNPDQHVVLFNYASVDPLVTNDKCNYWHVRWPSNSDMRVKGLAAHLKDRKEVKKVFLLNQDYALGQSVRKAYGDMIKPVRPDIEVVGDELHPLMKVTDFAPYIAKIKASGADSVITSDWGQDLALLFKAAADAGLKVRWFTFFSTGVGAPTAIRQAGLDNLVFDVFDGNAGVDNAAYQEVEKSFRDKYKRTMGFPGMIDAINVLAQVGNAEKTTDIGKIAAKMEGVKFKALMGDEGFVRRDDHQTFTPMFVSTLGPKKADAKFDEEGTGWSWSVISKIKPEETVVPTTCKMERP